MNSATSSLRDLLVAHLPSDEKEAADLQEMLGWLGRLPHPFSQKQPEAHFTASAVVVDPSSNDVCLVRHRHLDRWLQPGGHVESSDEDLGQTALREAREETGLQLDFHPSAPRPLDVDIHLFPERDGFPAHHHLDLRFLLIAQAPEELVHQAEEAHDARWFTWSEALGLPSEPAMKRMLNKAMQISASASEDTGELILGFLCSREGRTMQAIVRAWREGRLTARPAAVISNNSDSGALRFGREEGISAYHLSDKTHPDPEELDEAILTSLRDHGVDLVLLIGYMKLLGPKTLSSYEGRVLNVHPAPLPEYGGKGMYGLRVHEAVLASGAAKTAVSIHLVDEEYDHGQVIARRLVLVHPDDTPESLADRVRKVEAEFFVEVLRSIADGSIELSR